MSFDSAQNSSDRRGVPQLVPTGEHKGKAPILLNRPVFQIGARESCRIKLVSSTVSQVHAIIVQTRHLTYIRDLCSRSHVYVNDEQIKEHPLTDGDHIKIGRFEFIYRGPRSNHGDEPPALPATLEVTGSPMPVPIEERVILIGRRRTADIPLLEESVSNAHAVIFSWEGKRFVRDLGSRTGTFRNGKQIHEKELKPGDVIRVGDTEIRYTPSTEIASVEIIDSATDSQIAAAPSAEEVDFGIDLPTKSRSSKPAGIRGNAYAPDLTKLSDTIGDMDVVDSSHHDTAMIPLSFTRSDLADTASASAHGLELVPDGPVEEPMPRTWRESSANDLPPISIDLPADMRIVDEPLPTLESVARDEVTDLGLTSGVADLSTTFPPADPVELPAQLLGEEVRAEVLDDEIPFDGIPVDEAPVEEGNATVDLSSVDFVPTEPTNSSDIPTEEVSEAPLISLEPEAPQAETEVIESTDPTPESALNIPESTIDDTLVVSEPDPLSDTNFNRQVDEFANDPGGEIVEPQSTSPQIEEPLDPINLDDLALDAVSSPDDALETQAVDDFTADDSSIAVDLSEAETSEPAVKANQSVETQDLPIAGESSPSPVDAEIPAAPELEIAQPIERPAPNLSLDIFPSTPAAAPPAPEPVAAQIPETTPEPVVSKIEESYEAPAAEPEHRDIETPLGSTEPEPLLTFENAVESAPAAQESLADLDDLALDALSDPEAPAPDPQVNAAAVDAPIEEFQVEESVVSEVPHEVIASEETAVDDVPVENISVEPELGHVESPLGSTEPEPLLTFENAVESAPAVQDEPANLDDLALDALNEPEPIAIEPEPAALDFAEPEVETAPAPLFGATTDPQVESRADAIEELSVEGNASLTPTIEPETESTFTGDFSGDLTSADLISPPIQPLAPDLHEIDLGLEPLPDLPESPKVIESEPSTLSDSISLTDLSGGQETLEPQPLPHETPLTGSIDIPSMAAPVVPLKKRRDRDKPTVIRKFGQDSQAPEAAGPVESPFAAAKINDQTSINEFPAVGDGSVDVFGSASPALADDLLSSLSNGKLGETETASTPTNKQRRRPGENVQRIAPRPVQPIGDPAAQRRPALAYSDAAVSSADGEIRRRKLLRRIPVVLLIGLIFAAGAWFAAPKLFPVVYEFQAMVRFDNLQASSRQTQQVFQESQIKSIFNDATRRNALLKLKDRYPQVSPGFLNDTDEYFKAVSRTDWSSKTPGLLTIRYAGTDRVEDNARILAVALSIHQNNSDLVMRSKDASRNYAAITVLAERAKSKIAELTEQMEKDRLIGERYQPEKLTAANTQVQQLEKLYNDSIAALKGAQAELENLKKSAANAPAAQGADGVKPADDAELAELTKKAEEMSAKLNQARAERAELAKQARESLDAAYEQFQKQITSAQGAMQQSPELAKFVSTAQSQLKTIREMTDEFIASQQTEYQQLAEIKAKLDEKMQARRADLWAKDEQLQQSAEQREITIRKINAAKSENLEKEIADLSNDLNLIESTIKARQDVLATDPLYADVINSLQQIIETKQKQLAENRKKTDQKLADFQRQFAASMPTVEKLPQEQQVLAADMKQRLAEIDSARRQYAAAADTAGLENDAVLKSMTQQLASMQGDIEVRKQQILAAANGAAAKQVAEQIAVKEKQIAELSVAQEKAQQSFFAAQASQREMMQARNDAEAAMNRRYEAQRERETQEATREQTERDLVSKKKAMDEAITPIEPTEADVTILREDDRRTIASIASSSGVFLLSLLIVLYLAYAAARANPYPHHNVEPEEQSAEQEPHENEPAVV